MRVLRGLQGLRGRNRSMADAGGPVEAPHSAPAAALRWQFAALSDRGRLRAGNEDAVAVNPALGLALVADGMGGYNAGEVASAMAVASLQESFGRWLACSGANNAQGPTVCRALQLGVDTANAEIREAARKHPQFQGMGTTLVLAAFGPRRVVVGHIGDSRCYRLQGGRLEQLTRDHSMLQEQLDAGLITERQAARSPHRNLVTRALGVERKVRIDVRGWPACAGDLLLLCSDGLSEMLGPAQLVTLLSKDADLADKAALLVAAANHNGGHDNISVVLARSEEE